MTTERSNWIIIAVKHINPKPSVVWLTHYCESFHVCCSCTIIVDLQFVKLKQTMCCELNANHLSIINKHQVIKHDISMRRENTYFLKCPVLFLKILEICIIKRYLIGVELQNRLQTVAINMTVNPFFMLTILKNSLFNVVKLTGFPYIISLSNGNQLINTRYRDNKGERLIALMGDKRNRAPIMFHDRVGL